MRMIQGWLHKTATRERSACSGNAYRDRSSADGSHLISPRNSAVFAIICARWRTSYVRRVPLSLKHSRTGYQDSRNSRHSTLFVNFLRASSSALRMRNLERENSHLVLYLARPLWTDRTCRTTTAMAEPLSRNRYAPVIDAGLFRQAPRAAKCSRIRCSRSQAARTFDRTASDMETDPFLATALRPRKTSVIPKSTKRSRGRFESSPSRIASRNGCAKS